MVTHTPHAGQWVREPHSDCPGGLREALSEPADAAQCRPDVPPERWGFSGAGLLARALLGRGGGCLAGGAGTSPGAYAVGLTDARVRFVRRHWSRPFRPRGGAVGGGGFCPNGTTLKPLRAGWMKSNHPDLRIYERILQAVAS